MNKKLILIVAVVAIAAFLFLKGGESCDSAKVQEGQTKIAEAVKSIAASNPQKLVDIQAKIQDISKKYAGSTDVADACNAQNEILDLLK